ncbi:hypothetical protein L1987_06885 [Smallanthus sonchifolius]|uniref:Uncharacterized protein n=1 Tax=Smallanthus sonchifolius TaxID=185202 RepID=A0ACB9JZE1_9ASTR|nr:hypothetical protein L1987_06885 [Smallanthus sonchifolius]
MNGNIHLLEDVKKIDGGYVSFAGSKGGYITSQGTLKNDKVKFEKVNYVEQLKHNLLSVSQVCDKKFSFHFNDSECFDMKPGFIIPEEWILMRDPRRNDTYVLDMSVATTTDSVPTFLLSKLAHINFRKMSYLVENDLVIGVPKMKFSVPDDCIPCKKGKLHRKSHKSKKQNSIVTPLELLHMDLFGPINETAETVRFLILRLENLFKQKVMRIRSDNGTEFKNNKMGFFCLQKGIHHEFSAPYVPQQNGVAERKNRTLVETARTMLADSKLPVEEWFHIDCSNRSIPQKAVGPEWAFDYDSLSKCFNFAPELSVEDVAVLYESCNGDLDCGFTPRSAVPLSVPSSTPDPNAASCLGTHETDSDDVEAIFQDSLTEPLIVVDDSSTYTQVSGEISSTLDPMISVPQVVPSQVETTQVDVSPIPEIEPKNVEMMLQDNNWIEAMQKELAQFDKLKERTDYTEVYAPVARLEAIRLFLAFASFKVFKVYQLDVKRAFLYGKVKESRGRLPDGSDLSG